MKDDYKRERVACALQDGDTLETECEYQSYECEECPIYIKHWEDFEKEKKRFEEICNSLHRKEIQGGREC